MARIALLIGISEYLSDLTNLPSTLKDVEAMKEVLGNSEMGGFDKENIKVLKNSNRQEIEEEIYELFADRKEDDILLFYFSGHGVLSRKGHLFLATPQTRKGQRDIVRPTAVSANVLQSEMDDSFSEHLVVILDCCYSGAFTEGMTAKGNENIDIQAELGGKGRAILMSSSSTQSSFQSEGSALSIYTKYLVEGIKTGAADTDNDGKIAADELHQYVSEKVTAESPNMTPKYSGSMQEGNKIYLARSPQNSLKLQYRRKVQEILHKNNGSIDFLKRYYLDELRQKYGMSDGEANVIEKEEMEPYNQYYEKLKRYKKIFSQTVENYGYITEKERETLQDIQLVLGLRDEDVAPIEEQFLPQSNDEVKLLSDKNVDYTKLRDFLAKGEWKEADIETGRCMLKAAEREKQGYLNVEDIENFSCTDIRTIDQLWVKYSDHKFGFSVQKKVYESLGGTKEYNRQIWEEFVEKVGWRKGNEWLSYDELFLESSTHYMGQMPFCRGLGTGGGAGSKVLMSWVDRGGRLFSRVETCGL